MGEKNGDSQFPMLSSDSAERVDLVHHYILDALTNKIKLADIGLCCDDSLGNVYNKNGYFIDRTRIKLYKIFGKLNLKTTRNTKMFIS